MSAFLNSLGKLNVSLLRGPNEAGYFSFNLLFIGTEKRVYLEEEAKTRYTSLRWIAASW